jgi:hypothetical protein
MKFYFTPISANRRRVKKKMLKKLCKTLQGLAFYGGKPTGIF